LQLGSLAPTETSCKRGRTTCYSVSRKWAPGRKLLRPFWQFVMTLCSINGSPTRNGCGKLEIMAKVNAPLRTLNMGMSTQCAWLNDRATLKGRTVFYDKKKIRISNSKVTNTKHIRFYYVLSAGKPTSTVPSDQGFYQSLWDSSDRSNRSLKRTAA
jgi:hypothetical protein